MVGSAFCDDDWEFLRCPVINKNVNGCFSHSITSVFNKIYGSLKVPLYQEQQSSWSVFHLVFIAMTASPSVLPSYKLVEVAFSSAIHILDKQYGEGYSKKNPQLIASLCQIILDWSPTISGVSDPSGTDLPVDQLDHDLMILYSAYADYENKIISSQDVMNKLRDCYYWSVESGLGVDGD